jgi:hypothetical protein
VYNETVAQYMPMLVLAALYTDIKQDKWFAEKSFACHPPREVGLLVKGAQAAT